LKHNIKAKPSEHRPSRIEAQKEKKSFLYTHGAFKEVDRSVQDLFGHAKSWTGYENLHLIQSVKGPRAEEWWLVLDISEWTNEYVRSTGPIRCKFGKETWCLPSTDERNQEATNRQIWQSLRVTDQELHILWKKGLALNIPPSLRAEIPQERKEAAKIVPPFGVLPDRIIIDESLLTRQRLIQDIIKLPICHYNIRQSQEVVDIEDMIPGLEYRISYHALGSQLQKHVADRAFKVKILGGSGVTWYRCRRDHEDEDWDELQKDFPGNGSFYTKGVRITEGNQLEPDSEIIWQPNHPHMGRGKGGIKGPRKALMKTPASSDELESAELNFSTSPSHEEEIKNSTLEI
jgi:hypothetical protein